MNKFEREQIDFLLCTAYNAAIKAGDEIMRIYDSPNDMSVSLKADSTPITLADRNAHRIIVDNLSVTRIPVLSEEGREMLYDERRNWDLFWMIDPLDGTEEFIKRNGEFTVNIALMSDNKPLFGVIYVPVRSQIYFSDPDRGAFYTPCIDQVKEPYSISSIFMNSKQLPLTKGVNNPVRVAVSRSHETAYLQEIMEGLRSKYGELDILKCGSSLKLCLLASGEVDIYIRTTNTMEWDIAAGDAIVSAAGGKLIMADDGTMEYNREDMVNPAIKAYSKYILSLQ